MQSGFRDPVMAVVAAAVLFGAATPVLKLLLGLLTPLVLAALLSLGAGCGVLFWLCLGGTGFPLREISRNDRTLLIGTVLIGGTLAPVVQFSALTVTSAATASLLLNFEIVATILIAFLFFREPIDQKTGIALAAIIAGSVVLSGSGDGISTISAGSFGILAACVLWGIDNNLMGRIGGIRPEAIVVIRGFCGGCITGIFALITGQPFPNIVICAIAFATGLFAFGGGLVFLISALRQMGAARAGAIYAAAPFVGCIVSLALFSEVPGTGFWIAVPLFLAGAGFIVWDHWFPQKNASFDEAPPVGAEECPGNGRRQAERLRFRKSPDRE